VDIKNNSNDTPLAVGKCCEVAGLLLHEGKANPTLALHAAAQVNDANRMEIYCFNAKELM